MILLDVMEHYFQRIIFRKHYEILLSKYQKESEAMEEKHEKLKYSSTKLKEELLSIKNGELSRLEKLNKDCDASIRRKCRISKFVFLSLMILTFLIGYYLFFKVLKLESISSAILSILPQVLHTVYYIVKEKTFDLGIYLKTKKEKIKRDVCAEKNFDDRQIDNLKEEISKIEGEYNYSS